MELKEYEQLFPHTNAEGLIWHTPNSSCAWRVDSLLTKEPDTIAWIETMGEADVLFDVGANMGQYSMLAAKRGVHVYAFEPESQNFALMCRNIAINKMQDRILPFPVALTDESGPNTFFVTQLVAGGSCNSFGESVNFNLQKKEFAFQQGCYGELLDKFALDYRFPTHIKIDVDGFEHKVLKGAKESLKSVKSVLVETNTNLEQHRMIEDFMRDNGLIPDMATAEKARRIEGAFKGVGNVIYFRSEADFLSNKGR